MIPDDDGIGFKWSQQCLYKPRFLPDNVEESDHEENARVKLNQV